MSYFYKALQNWWNAGEDAEEPPQSEVPLVKRVTAEQLQKSHNLDEHAWLLQWPAMGTFFQVRNEPIENEEGYKRVVERRLGDATVIHYMFGIIRDVQTVSQTGFVMQLRERAGDDGFACGRLAVYPVHYQLTKQSYAGTAKATARNGNKTHAGTLVKYTSNEVVIASDSAKQNAWTYARVVKMVLEELAEHSGENQVVTMMRWIEKMQRYSRHYTKTAPCKTFLRYQLSECWRRRDTEWVSKP
jgi:hypothetical protein